MSNFKVSNNGGDDWLICWTGQDENGIHWNVTTNQVHASELFQFSKGAEEDARLIADLLNKYYSNEKPMIDIKNEAQARLVAFGQTMPCGHLARYAVNGEDGTQYCSLCELEKCNKGLKELIVDLKKIIEDGEL